MNDMLFPEEATHHAGARTLPLPAGVSATAVYGGPLDCYRYWLEWSWDASKPILLAGMMNPSTATHLNGDATVCWVYRWAVRNGFGRMIVVNADAYRCTDQARLAEIEDPCGPENIEYIMTSALMADKIVVGYGKPKVKAVRGHGPRMVEAMLTAGEPIHAWGLSLDGTPKHPLYLKAETSLQLYRPCLETAREAANV